MAIDLNHVITKTLDFAANGSLECLEIAGLLIDWRQENYHYGEYGWELKCLNQN